MSEEYKGPDRRQSARDEELVKAVVCAIREEAAGLSHEEHLEHHTFMKEWIEEIRLKRARREELKTKVMGWGLISVLGAIGSGTYQAFLYVREHMK